MSSFSPLIITKLQEVRRKTFSSYDEITLDQSALKIFARLFVNPDCQTDLDLFSLTEPQVKLSFLGDHIITAGPSTIAQFAERRKLKKLTAAELLTCFALDHAHDVHDNHVAEDKNAMYALAHILLPSSVTALKTINASMTATLESKTSWGMILFQHVVVPRDMHVLVGEQVYHHFGVIVAHAGNDKLGKVLAAQQHHLEFLQQHNRDAANRNITIDFADERIFRKDVLGLILKPHTRKLVKNPGDLKHKKIKFKN